MTPNPKTRPRFAPPSLLLRRFGYSLRDAQVWVTRDDWWGDTYEYYPDLQLNRFRFQIWRPDLNFWNTAAWTDTFDYDPVGNRTSLNENGTVTSYTANALNQYTAVTGTFTSYDGRGNLVDHNGWVYAYNAENQLIKATKIGTIIQFYYDPEGRLTRVNRSGTDEYRYYDWGQCFFRSRADGTWIDFMVWGPTPDELISRWDAAHGGWSFFHRTPVNSPDLATDINANVVERYLYDPFGAPDIRDPSWGGRSASVIYNPWLFTGQEWMSDTGLSNYKARFYSPKLGRFLQNDPIRFDAGDVNLYRYCGNNSVNRADPDGKIAPLVVAAIGAAVGGTINAIQNYDAYKSGKMDGLAYATSIATGAGYGALATLAPGVGAGAALGGATAVANSVTNNALRNEEVNGQEAVVSGALGAASGAVAGLVQNAAGAASSPIGKVLGEGRADPAAGSTAGAVANTVGSIASAAVPTSAPSTQDSDKAVTVIIKPEEKN